MSAEPPNPPTLLDLVAELREAVGLFTGAMPISPKQAWEEAVARVVELRRNGGFGCAGLARGASVSGCVFCEIIDGKAPATIVAETPNTITIVPLNPVTEGHVLVIPRVHGAYLWELPGWNGGVLFDIGEQAKQAYPCNIIQSNGAKATQTVLHVHFHIVPRREGDGLMLPWSDPQEGGEE